MAPAAEHRVDGGEEHAEQRRDVPHRPRGLQAHHVVGVARGRSRGRARPPARPRCSRARSGREHEDVAARHGERVQRSGSRRRRSDSRTPAGRAPPRAAARARSTYSVSAGSSTSGSCDRASSMNRRPSSRSPPSPGVPHAPGGTASRAASTMATSGALRLIGLPAARTSRAKYVMMMSAPARRMASQRLRPSRAPRRSSRCCAAALIIAYSPLTW